MTSFRNRVVFSCLSIVGTAGLVLFANPASAAATSDGVRQASVYTADLNLANAAGRATFERRVAAAARTVCSEQTASASPTETACRRNAMAQARRATGLVDVASN